MAITRALFLFLILAVGPSVAQLNISNPFYVAGIMKPTAAVTGTAWISDSPATATRNDFGGCVGLRFTTVGAQTVTALRLYVLNGNTETVTITITSSDGSSTICTGNINTTGLATGWHEVSVSGSLAATTTYQLFRTVTNGGDLWHDSWEPTENTAIAAIDNALFDADCSGTFSGGSGNASFSGVDFKYQ